jgi:Domain of unknown function (DUF397)
MRTTRNSDLVWRKARACPNNATCVEIAALPDGSVAIRDSKDPEGPQLRFNAAEWAAFLVAVKADQFDPSAEA